MVRAFEAEPLYRAQTHYVMICVCAQVMQILKQLYN